MKTETKTTAWLATVHLLIPKMEHDETEDMAMDGVSAMLTHSLEADGEITDWAYAKTPSGSNALREIEIPEDYSEGDFIGDAARETSAMRDSLQAIANDCCRFLEYDAEFSATSEEDLFKAFLNTCERHGIRPNIDVTFAD